MNFLARLSMVLFVFVVLGGCNPSSDYDCSSMFGGDGKDGALNAPLDVAADSEGQIYVADTANNRVQVFNPDGTFNFRFGKAGDGVGHFRSPCGLAIDKQGNIYIADTLNNRIQKFTNRGRHLSTIESSTEKLYNPKDVAVNSSGYLYVVDSYNNEIKKFDPIGQFSSKFGGKGAGPGEFNRPDGIFVDFNDKKYVVDSRNLRVQVFGADDNFEFEIKEKGQYGRLLGPSKIAVDSTGNIFVVDCGQIPLIKFSPKGEFITRVAEFGKGQKGKVTLPSGVAIIDAEKIAVLDRHLGIVQIFVKK